MNIFENAEFISCEDNNRLFSVMIENKGKIIFSRLGLKPQAIICRP